MSGGRDAGRQAVLWLAFLVAASCAGRAPEPAEWVSGRYQCQTCRMTVVDRGFASQMVTALDEPRFFDDTGCLSTFLTRTPAIPGAAVYVADHRTGAWVPAGEAMFVRVDALTAPMGSHVVAYASDASRAADPPAAAGTAVDRVAVIPAPWSGGRP